MLGDKPDLPSGGGDDITADASNRKRAKLYKVRALVTPQTSTFILVAIHFLPMWLIHHVFHIFSLSNPVRGPHNVASVLSLQSSLYYNFSVWSMNVNQHIKCKQNPQYNQNQNTFYVTVPIIYNK